MEKFVIPAAIVLLGLLASAAWATPAGAAETNTITCNLQRTTGEFRVSRHHGRQIPRGPKAFRVAYQQARCSQNTVRLVRVAGRFGARRHDATTISAGAQLPPTIDDIRIIQRASMLLADPAKWNRQDDRSCPPETDVARSLL